MTIGLKTPNHFVDAKLEAVGEVLAHLGLAMNVAVDAFNPLPDAKQNFGFEELIQKARQYAREVISGKDVDVGVGIESSLSFIYSSNAWYYINSVAVQTRSGGSAASFTPGIIVPSWLIQEIHGNNIQTLHALIERQAGHPVDPVDFFSGYAITRKELLVPPLLITISQLKTELESQTGK